MTIRRTDPAAVVVASHDPLLIEIGIGELVVANAPHRILTPALGSCVGVAIYDLFARRGGLAHIMLPCPTKAAHNQLPGRFAELAVPELVNMLRAEGSLRGRLQAKIAGGAAMFHGDSVGDGVGARNVAEVKRQLTLMKIPLLAEDTGEAHARTVELALETGEFVVRSYQFGVTRL